MLALCPLYPRLLSGGLVLAAPEAAEDVRVASLLWAHAVQKYDVSQCNDVTFSHFISFQSHFLTPIL